MNKLILLRSAVSAKLLLIIGILWLTYPVSAIAQAAISIEHFENASEWPIFMPGEIKLDNAELGNLRVGYDGIFATPQGPLVLGTYIDVMDVMFNGKSADWMQWTFTSEEEGKGGVANLDLLIMDQETGALNYRMLPSAPGSTWGGPYNFIGVGDSEVKRIILSDDSELSTEIIPIEGNIYDFGGLPFVFPFMNLQNGQGIRLKAYQQSGADGVQLLDVKVIGPVTISDVDGNEHEVTEVQTLPPSRATLVSFYISDKAPYFYGWDYRRIDDGVSLFKMTYRGFVSTEIKK